jgi:hypothetical protein
MQGSARKPYEKPTLTKQGTLAAVKAAKGWPVAMRAG